MSLYKVTSEIFTENENPYVKRKSDNAISSFVFRYPSYLIEPKCRDAVTRDQDDDVDVDRQQQGKLLIEHHISTELQHVGLQVWRGALLLADYILSNPDLFRDKTVLELGAGVGLTSIVASFLAKDVICTDIDVKGILDVIRRNVARNSGYVKSRISVTELDFLNLDWPALFRQRINEATVILAADVIYDDKITEGFVGTLEQLLDSAATKVAYVALEKRYVFTTSNLDTTAPMYEDFLRCIEKKRLDWRVENVTIDFPQYFKYNRVKQMILMRIENKSTD